MPVEEYIEMTVAQRNGKTPFIYAADGKKRLVRMAVSSSMVALVEERRRNWHLLQYLDGQHVARMDSDHRATVAALQAEVQSTSKQRDVSLDGIARAMSELAASSKAQVGNGTMIPIVPVGGGATQSACAAAATATATGEALVTYDEADQAKCTNCKTCYQDLSELFEKTRIVVDGESREVGRLIPGILERITPTPELKSRIKRVSANCDAEIIR